MGCRGRAKQKGNWITLRQTAEILGMSYKDALKAAQNFEIPGMKAHKPGCDYRFDKNDVVEHARKQKRT